MLALALAGRRSGVLARTMTRSMAASSGDKIAIRDVVRDAIDEEMKRDSAVMLMGEEVAQYDGAYKATRGLFQKYGEDRVIDTPITEYGFAGVGVGAALGGVRPIVEFMTFNFAMQAIDHVVNSAAKGLYMSDGQLHCPIVFRGPNGPPKAVGAQHSQCFAAWYGSVPGLKVVAPYSAIDHKGLLKAAIRDPNPVVVLESEILYPAHFDVTPELQDPDFVLDIGKAHTERQGRDVTMVAFSRGVQLALDAAQVLADKHGIDAEVINLRSIRPLDVASIVKSVSRTHRLVSVEEGWPQHGVGAELAAQVSEQCWDELDAPPARVASADVPMPYAENLETEVMVQVEDIVTTVRRTMGRS